VEVEPLVRPRREHDLDGFAEAFGALLDRHPEGRELGRVEAAACAPPAGENVQQRSGI